MGSTRPLAHGPKGVHGVFSGRRDGRFTERLAGAIDRPASAGGSVPSCAPMSLERRLTHTASITTGRHGATPPAGRGDGRDGGSGEAEGQMGGMATLCPVNGEPGPHDPGTSMVCGDTRVRLFRRWGEAATTSTRDVNEGRASGHHPPA
jgi:hypothetical protein